MSATIDFKLSINLQLNNSKSQVNIMTEKIWKSVDEVHSHAELAINKKVRDLVKDETLMKYYEKRNNKGWVGNSIESDWFSIPNNSRKEADIPYLDLDIKVTPIRLTKNGWSAKERLTLNLFDFNEEHNKTFDEASFFKKATYIELLYYEYKDYIDSPDFIIKAANLLNLKDLPKEDLLIIEQDWNTIIKKIKEGKAEELSDSLTKYLGATTKGAKTESNLTSQPFSETRAHRRAFTLKGAYMSTLAKKFMDIDRDDEKIIKDINELKQNSFEDIVLHRFKPYVGHTKKELASIFDMEIPERNDKASSAALARKMLNLDGEIEDTEEFNKADISVRIMTIIPQSKKSTEGFKIIIPGENSIEPEIIVNQSWEDSSLREHLSSQQFLLVIFEKIDDETIFKGAKFWRVNYDDLETTIQDTWTNVRSILNNGVKLEYKKQVKPTATGKLYQVKNNLPGMSSTPALHVRPSAEIACYHNNLSLAMKLPVSSRWINKPNHTDWIPGRRPSDLPINELTDEYMTKQVWWLNPKYMYKQVKEFFE